MTRHAVPKIFTPPKAIDLVHRQDLTLATQIFDFALKAAKRLLPTAVSRPISKKGCARASSAATRLRLSKTLTAF